MPLSDQEKTRQQYPWGIFNPLNWGWTDNALIRAVRGSGSAEGTNPYAPVVMAETGMGRMLDGKPWPGTLATYRVMSSDPTFALAEAAVTLGILAAEWSVDVDEELSEDATAQKGKAILETELVKCRPNLMRGCLLSLRYGWKTFEVVFERKTNGGIAYTGVKKFKQLLGENVDIGVDEHGNLAQVISLGTPLDAPYFLHIVNDKEDDNWYGRSRHENGRRVWANYLDFEDRKAELGRKGTGTCPYVGVPSDTKEDIDSGKQPNMKAAQKIADSVKKGGTVAYYNLTGLSAENIVNNADLAGKSTVSIATIDAGNPGPMFAALIAGQEYLDKIKVRAWLQPERTLIEASKAGSRADSESHGDLSVSDAEATNEAIVDQINAQTVRALILENCGEKYVDRIRIAAVPLQDARREALAKFMDAMMQDSTVRHGLSKALGNEGMKGLIDQLGLDLKLENDFEVEPTQNQNDPRLGNDLNAAAEKELSAILELSQHDRR